MEKKYGRITMIVALLIVVALIGIVVWNQNRIFSIEKSMETTAYSFEGEKVPLKDVMYYIMMEEDAVNELALTYDAENPRAYWNLFISGKFVSKLAAQTACNYAIRDDLYAKEAEKLGLILSEEEKQDAKIKAQAIFDGMTEKQLNATHLTVEQITAICEQRTLVNNLCVHLAKERELEIEEDVLQKYYGLESKYFDELQETYKVVINKSLWNNISLGAVTIN